MSWFGYEYYKVDKLIEKSLKEDNFSELICNLDYQGEQIRDVEYCIDSRKHKKTTSIKVTVFMLIKHLLYVLKESERKEKRIQSLKKTVKELKEQLGVLNTVQEGRPLPDELLERALTMFHSDYLDNLAEGQLKIVTDLTEEINQKITEKASFDAKIENQKKELEQLRAENERLKAQNNRKDIEYGILIKKLENDPAWSSQEKTLKRYNKERENRRKELAELNEKLREVRSNVLLDYFDERRLINMDKIISDLREREKEIDGRIRAKKSQMNNLTQQNVALCRKKEAYLNECSRIKEDYPEEIRKIQAAYDRLTLRETQVRQKEDALNNRLQEVKDFVAKYNKKELMQDIKEIKEVQTRYAELIGELQSALVFLAKKRGINVKSSTEVLEFIKKYKRIAKEPDIYSSQSFTDGSGSLPQVSLDTLSDTVLDTYYYLYGRELDDSVLGDLSEIRRKGTLDAYIKRIQEEL